MSVLDFPRQQLALLFARESKTGKVTRRHKSTLQKAVVSASSLCYLIPCVAYLQRDDSVGASLFLLVTIFSALADGSWFEDVPILQLIDKWTATAGGLYAVLPKLWPWATASVMLQFLVATFFSVVWLVLARRATETWNWVALQSLWHLFSACAVARGTWCQADGTGCLHDAGLF